MLDQKTILITGGTGFLGKELLRLIVERYPRVKRVIVYSRDELKQFNLAQRFPPNRYPVQYVLGDIRDSERLRQASQGIDYIIHTAALKQVPAAERNPLEYMKTNVVGTQHVVQAALVNGVEKVVALSTDKAVAPLGVYGATKLCAERLVTVANEEQSLVQTRLSVIRFGNILGSHGSVLPFFRERRREGILPMTDEKMTRFSVLVSEAAEKVLWVLHALQGGEVYVPKLPSYRLVHLAEAVAPECTKKFEGIRAGEKIHEELLTETEAPLTYDIGNYYVILPRSNRWNIDEYIRRQGGKSVPLGFRYTSETNPDYLNIEQLRSLISKA